MSLRSIAKEQITVAATAIGFTDSNIHPTSGASNVLMALVTVSTAQIRISCTGTDPTSLLGISIEAGDVLEVWGEPDLTRFRAIRTTATSAILDVEYFGEG